VRIVVMNIIIINISKETLIKDARSYGLPT